MVIDGTDPFAASKPDARLDDCRGKGGQRGPVNREVTHDCGDKAARRGPQRQAQEKAGAVLRAVRMTIAIAPTTVPIMRNEPLRSEAPRLG